MKRDGARHTCATRQGGGPFRALKPRVLSLEEAPSAPHVIQKRAFDDFPTDSATQDQWMVDNVASATIDAVPPPVNGQDINSGIYHKIGGRNENNDLFSIGLGKMVGSNGRPIRNTGCTALVVMSEKAVYVAHYWEDISYDTQAHFTANVINLVKSGNNQNSDLQKSLQSKARDFKGKNHLGAFIFEPVADEVYDENGDPQPVDVDPFNKQLATTVSTIIGISPTIVRYTPDEVNVNGADGRLLYQYDPQAVAPDPNNKDDKGKRGFRLIFERTNYGTSLLDS